MCHLCKSVCSDGTCTAPRTADINFTSGSTPFIARPEAVAQPSLHLHNTASQIVKDFDTYVEKNDNSGSVSYSC